jgi:tripartite-type tricarboxylate transporter receptor subunit TctC
MPTGFLRASRRTLLLTAAAGLAALCQPTDASAQAWPSRPVTLVVAYGPGASNDTFTRAIAGILTKRFGQPFVVENRPGAGGFTGTQAVSKAEPDGYTWLEMPSGVASFGSVMEVKFDPVTDLQPVALFARTPTAMLVPAALPVKTVKEFNDHARANPDKMFYGFAGIGTAQHQHAEMYKTATGLKIKGVNYKSSADAQTDLVAGRLQVMFVTIASTLARSRAGSCASWPTPTAIFPPTCRRRRLSRRRACPIWRRRRPGGRFFAPPKTPQDIVMKMNSAINDALKDPDFAAQLARSGATPAPGDPSQLAATLKDEITGLTEFAKSAGMMK